MIRSMTGFGRCEVADGERKFTVEMKGVNHRYLDVNIRMPKKLNFFETSIRNLLKKRIQRGKVDLFISYEDLSEGQVSLKYNEALARNTLIISGRWRPPSDWRMMSGYPPFPGVRRCSLWKSRPWMRRNCGTVWRRP